MSEWMVFADRLKKEIERQGFSYRQLADKMHMTTTTLFRYAKGQRIPRANEILKAANALGVTCDYLLGLSDEPLTTAAQPERKMGKWILKPSPDKYHCGYVICPFCKGEYVESDEYNFCPNCGADMRGEEDGQDD